MLFIISISKKRQKKEIVPDKKKENKKKKKKINIMNTLGNNYLLMKKRDLKDLQMRRIYTEVFVR